jgi:hypothetical protein
MAYLKKSPARITWRGFFLLIYLFRGYGTGTCAAEAMAASSAHILSAKAFASLLFAWHASFSFKKIMYAQKMLYMPAASAGRKFCSAQKFLVPDFLMALITVPGPLL